MSRLTPREIAVHVCGNYRIDLTFREIARAIRETSGGDVTLLPEVIAAILEHVVTPSNEKTNATS